MIVAPCAIAALTELVAFNPGQLEIIAAACSQSGWTLVLCFTRAWLASYYRCPLKDALPLQVGDYCLARAFPTGRQGLLSGHHANGVGAFHLH